MDTKIPKLVLTMSAQEYGLTIEDILERNPNITKDDILVEKYDGEYWNLKNKILGENNGTK